MNKVIPLLFICFVGHAQQKIDFKQFYPVDRSHSYIEFSIKYMGYAKVKGRFSDFSGMVYYDEKNPQHTSVTLSIKTESIDTDNDFRDNDLKSDNWFEANQFPTIAFVSKSLKKISAGYELKGDLTIKKVTKEVIIKMDPPSGILKDVRQDSQIIFTGSTTLNRKEYGVEGKNWSAIKEGITAVSDEVSIEFSILVKQVKAPNFSNRLKNIDSPAGKIYKIFKEEGLQKAIDAFKSSHAETPLDPRVLSTAGYMLVLEENIKDAISLYEVNLETFPNNADINFDLGEAYGLLGEMNKSKGYLQEAVRIKPDFTWALEILRHLK